MFRCSICLDEDEAFGVLLCGALSHWDRLHMLNGFSSAGHVFGMHCLNQHFSFRRDCPKCRATAEPEDVRNIFLDNYDPSTPENVPDKKGLKDISNHLPTIEGIMRRSKEVNVDSEEGEVAGLIQAAERVAVHFDEYKLFFNVRWRCTFSI